MSQLTRREMLERSMLATAAALAASPLTGLGIGQSALAADAPPQSTSPNEQLLCAIIGVRSRGREHISEFSQRKDVRIAMICDADADVGNSVCEEIAKSTGHKPEFVQDMRRVFENPSINFISTATPNHWHALTAIWAMQAGKDVYVEKPVSHNVSEGRRIVQAAEKLGRICQVGTQSRSTGGMRAAMEYVHTGKLGEVKLARGLCYKRRPSIGAAGEFSPPKSVDYDLWCGPAPLAPLTRKQFHYDWHWQWPYGNGDLGNQGIHQMDLCRWALNVNQLSKRVISYGGRFGYVDSGETPNTQVVVHDFGDKSIVFEVRGLETGDFKTAKVGIIVEGSDGYLVMTSYSDGTVFDKNGQAIKQFRGGGNHFHNFVDAVRAHDASKLQGPILEGHLSSALCHTGNISYLLGQPVGPSELRECLQEVKLADDVADTLERTTRHLDDNHVHLDDSTRWQAGEVLTFDPVTETFPGNARANDLLTREYRAPFVVPSTI
ncbi:MAG: Gfo/Idh/MocA family oxidoreductase [Pirellulales bacterium]|nr:Gfo/Idh/MocA family oxidoreductase [Pirellulales bacterium]